MFTTRTVVGLVLFTAALVGSQYIFSATQLEAVRSLERTITELSARVNANDQIAERDEMARQRETAADRKIADDWRQAIEKRIDQIDREYKLKDYELADEIQKLHKR